MTDRGDAEANQIIGGQLRQNFAVDVVVTEGGGILFESQPAQPIGDLGGHCRASCHRLGRCRRWQPRPSAVITEILAVAEENLEGTMSTPIFLIQYDYAGWGIS